MSRSVKNLTGSGGRKEDSGMEVMDIESDNEEPNLPTPPNAFAASTKSAPPTQYRLPFTKESEELKKKEPPATPLTNSESLKRETSKGGDSTRASSPTQLPTSHASQLGLPDMGDTFHAPPRSILPPLEASSPGAGSSSTITKTLRFVSGFLGSREASSPKAKGKSKERAPDLSVGDEGSPVDILQFGKELLRTSDMIGKKIDPVLLNGEYKVAIISIAGGLLVCPSSDPHDLAVSDLRDYILWDTVTHTRR